MGAGNLMIVQGGGPTAVFNASLSSAILEATSQPAMGRIYGARYGMKGLVHGDIVELGQMTAGELQLPAQQPGRGARILPLQANARTISTAWSRRCGGSMCGK